MLSGLPSRDTPEWLKDLKDVVCVIDPDKVLTDSVFSPITLEGTDIIQLLGASFYTFAFSASGLLPSTNQIVGPDIWIPSIRQVSSRRVGLNELSPDHLLQQNTAAKLEVSSPIDFAKALIAGLSSSQIVYSGGETGEDISGWFLCDDDKLARDGQSCHSYSILRMSGEADMVYKRIYWDSQKVPALLSLIEPRCEGWRFGLQSVDGNDGNEDVSLEELQAALSASWKRACSPEGEFRKTVVNHPVGKPEYLLIGGSSAVLDFKEPLWPEFCELVSFSKNSETCYALWK